MARDAVARAGEIFAALDEVRVGRPGAWRIERVQLEEYIQAMYEETRRRALWDQSDLASIPELSGGRIVWPDRD